MHIKYITPVLAAHPHWGVSADVYQGDKLLCLKDVHLWSLAHRLLFKRKG